MHGEYEQDVFLSAGGPCSDKNPDRGYSFFRDSPGGRKWASLERSLRSPRLIPSSSLTVVNRGILELTRDIYTKARRIIAQVFKML